MVLLSTLCHVLQIIFLALQYGNQQLYYIVNAIDGSVIRDWESTWDLSEDWVVCIFIKIIVYSSYKSRRNRYGKDNNRQWEKV